MTCETHVVLSPMVYRLGLDRAVRHRNIFMPKFISYCALEECICLAPALEKSSCLYQLQFKLFHISSAHDITRTINNPLKVSTTRSLLWNRFTTKMIILQVIIYEQVIQIVRYEGGIQSGISHSSPRISARTIRTIVSAQAYARGMPWPEYPAEMYCPAR